MNIRYARLGLFLIFAVGCAKESPAPIYEVEGNVRLDGKPLKGVTVRFYPTGAGPDNECVASGVTDGTGHFELTCTRGRGAVGGENVVTITESDPPPELANRESARKELISYYERQGGRPIPHKYGTTARSPLRATVSSEKKVYVFDLTR